jgi:hypothetical protein
VAAGITFTIGWRPFIGPRARALTVRTFESTPGRLARGAYLVRNVSDCMTCHSEHDWSAHDAPILPNALGAGQDMNFLKGLPGSVHAPNITPDPETGAGNWSDDQLARAIREGIGHDGAHYSRSCLRWPPRLVGRGPRVDRGVFGSLPPVRKQRPTTALIFPVKYLIRSVPEPLDAPVQGPDLSTPEKRGKYLVTIAGCSECHTPKDAQGQPLPDMDFGGGFILDGPWGRVASANLTPDPSGFHYDQARSEVLRTAPEARSSTKSCRGTLTAG